MNFAALAPFFKPSEKWGNHNKVDWNHSLHLVRIRECLLGMGLDWPMIIHCSYGKEGHAPNSYHHKDGISRATDFHFKTGAPFKEQVIKLKYALLDTRLDDFVGLGIYPDWNNPGFHLDSRGSKARWGKIAERYEYDMEIVKDYICHRDMACKAVEL
jgi:hypothetical protein